MNQLVEARDLPVVDESKPDALEKLDRATRMLAEARTLDEVKAVVDLAEAARTYFRAAKLGLEAQNHAAAIKLLAERKAGEILGELDKGQGGRPPKTPDSVSGVSEYRRTINEAQVPEKTAQRWQQVAAVPADRVTEYIDRTKADFGEVTTAGLLRSSRPNQPEKPFDKYREIVKFNKAVTGAINHWLECCPDRPDDEGNEYRLFPETRLAQIVADLRARREGAEQAAERTAAGSTETQPEPVREEPAAVAAAPPEVAAAAAELPPQRRPKRIVEGEAGATCIALVDGVICGKERTFRTSGEACWPSYCAEHVCQDRNCGESVLSRTKSEIYHYCAKHQEEANERHRANLAEIEERLRRGEVFVDGEWMKADADVARRLLAEEVGAQ